MTGVQTCALPISVSVPVNTRLTPTELRVILEDAGVRAIIACPDYRGRDYVAESREAADGIVPYIISASDETTPIGWRVIETGVPPRLSEPMDAADVFCIQYTSGTTSTPKGVMLTEARYLRTAAYCVQTHRLTPKDRKSTRLNSSHIPLSRMPSSA